MCASLAFSEHPDVELNIGCFDYLFEYWILKYSITTSNSRIVKTRITFNILMTESINELLKVVLFNRNYPETFNELLPVVLLWGVNPETFKVKK